VPRASGGAAGGSSAVPPLAPAASGRRPTQPGPGLGHAPQADPTGGFVEPPLLAVSGPGSGVVSGTGGGVEGELGLDVVGGASAWRGHGYSMPGGCITGAMADDENGSTTGPRYGITVPFDGVTLADHRRWYEELLRLGYTDAWSAETDGADGLTPLALAAAWTPALRLGVAILPAYTRGPGLLAQSVAALAEAAPGRFTLGLGTSSDVIVSRWNDVAFEEPYRRVRDTIRFLRAALAGEKVDHQYDTFRVRGFRLARPVEHPPPIFLAALRPGMLRLAGREADGVIINWLSAEDVSTVTPELGADIPVAARIFVCPSEDADAVRAVGRRMIAAYLNVGVYAAFHRWLGRGAELEPMWDAWQAGDRKRALAAIPDDLVDALVVHGSYDECRAHVGRYVANGVDIPVMAVIPLGMPLEEAVAGLAPPWTAG
jgi:probable F420-dependent oxidoreductase